MLYHLIIFHIIQNIRVVALGFYIMILLKQKNELLLYAYVLLDMPAYI